MRIKSKWHNSSKKTLQEMASALAFICWRLTKNHLEDLINEGFQVEKQQVFAVIQVYLYFLINCIDRLVFTKLSFAQRQELITAIVKQCAFYYQDNKSERIAEGDYFTDFITAYNQVSVNYSKCDFSTEPDYVFYKIFADGIKKATTKVDEKWIAQQIIEIQAPKAFKKIASSTYNVVNVANIISKKEKTKQIKNKVSRSKRKKPKYKETR